MKTTFGALFRVNNVNCQFDSPLVHFSSESIQFQNCDRNLIFLSNIKFTEKPYYHCLSTNCAEPIASASG